MEKQLHLRCCPISCLHSQNANYQLLEFHCAHIHLCNPLSFTHTYTKDKFTHLYTNHTFTNHTTKEEVLKYWAVINSLSHRPLLKKNKIPLKKKIRGNIVTIAYILPKYSGQNKINQYYRFGYFFLCFFI